MTVAEMHVAFDIQFNKLATSANINVKPEIKDYILYLATVRVIKTRYRPSNPAKEGFEQSEKRNRDLRDLVAYETLTPSGSGPDTNGVMFDLPARYWFGVRERAKVRYVDSCTGLDVEKNIKVVPTKQDTLEDVLINPLTKPWKEKLLRVNYATQNEIITFPDSTILNYFTVYVKKPLFYVHDISLWANSLFAISGNTTAADFTDVPEVSEEIHDDIVLEAVGMALSIIGSERYQANLNEIYKQD